MNEEAIQSCVDAERFQLVGTKTPTKRRYTNEGVSLRHAVYDQTLNLLENRRAVHVKSGDEIFSPLLPAVKRAMLLEGVSVWQLAQTEASLLDELAEHPAWAISRTVPAELFDHLESQGREHLIDNNRIVAAPSEQTNATVCNRLLTMFSQSDLLSCPGFILKRRSPDSYEELSLRLDLLGSYSRAGFIVPIIKNRLITALRVFRHPGDSRPFILKSRGGEVALND